MTPERYEILIGVRISKQLQAKLLAEQSHITKLTGIKPSINKVARMLIEKGLGTNGKKKR